MEGRPVAPEVDRVLQEAAQEEAAATEAALRAGLERLRRVREGEDEAEDPISATASTEEGTPQAKDPTKDYGERDNR
jgi:hypothetical protein